MIYFVTTAAHKYSVSEITEIDGAPETGAISYNRLFRAKTLPAASYIFTDFDRLNFWEIELAAMIFRQLGEAGMKVFNDPARVLQRLPLLKTLHRKGLNRFSVWDAAADPLPDAYPVFLRTRSAHRGVLSDLLNTPEDAETMLEELILDGYGINDLMFVEYCAEPVVDDIFRKLAVFKVGDQMLSTMAVHERHWSAKYGEFGVATPEMYQEEADIVETNRYAEQLAPAFEAARIEYGRADFTIFDGSPQIYEINTNPTISRIGEHPHEIRVEADALFHQRFGEALKRLDTPQKGAPVPLDYPDLIEQRRRDRLVVKGRWTP